MRFLPSSIFGKNLPEVEIVGKASRASVLRDEDTNAGVVTYTAGQSDIWTPYSETAEQLLHKYPNSIWLNVGISRIVESFSQVEFRIIDKRRESEADNDAKGRLAVKLAKLLEQPNPHMNRNEFKEAIALHLILTGNAFIEKVGVGANIKELYVLNPKNMRVIPDKQNFVKGYSYQVNGKAVSYTPEEIVHIKYFDPRGESRYGLSRISAARMSIQGDYDAVDWNAAYFRNATWPSGIIVCKDGINNEEYKRMKKELKENYEGKSKVGKVMVLTGGLDWRQTTPNPRDLDFATLRRRNREEILALLGVPPTIAGIYEFENTSSRSAGIREQVVGFWSNTLMPLSTKILDKINSDVVESFSENFKIVPDVSNIPALSDTEDMKKVRAETFSLLVTSGWPVEDALSEVYPKRTAFKKGSVAFLPSTLVRVSTEGEFLDPAPADPAPAAPEAPEAPEEKPVAKPKPKPKPKPKKIGVR